jgi:hypothetical protein
MENRRKAGTMPSTSRIFAAVALATVMGAMPALQAVALAVSQPAHPAGCHHRPLSPDRGPVSYDCCIGGHHAVVAATMFSLRPHLALLSGWISAAPITFDSAGTGPNVHLIVPFGSPPGFAPLRV